MIVRILTIAAVSGLLALGMPGAAWADTFDMCGSGQRVTCVVDGDTFWLDGEKIRISNIDTPELGSPACVAELSLAARATERLVELLNASPFKIRREGVDRYGRTLATLRSPTNDLGDQLVAEGLARTWSGRRESWC